MDNKSLLSIIQNIEHNVTTYLDPELTQFESRREMIEYTNKLVGSIQELSEEFINIVYELEAVEPKTVGLLKPLKTQYSNALNYTLSELSTTETTYPRLINGLEQIKKLKYHFH